MNPKNIRTKLLNDLQKRLSYLRNSMLHKKFDALGNYDDQTILLTEAYILLVHAEIESYIETVCHDLIKHVAKQWADESKTSPTLFCLLASYHHSWVEQEGEPKKAKDIKEAIQLATSQYSHIIKSNHGIKRNDLKKIIIPTGVDYANLDDSWINNMDAFGSDRGKIAHTSHKSRINSSVSPQDSLNKSNSLLEGIKKFDQEIIKLYLTS